MASRVLSTIICGNGITVCISEDETVFYFGKNTLYSNVLSSNFLPPAKVPSLCNIQSISLGLEHCICLDSNGNLFTFGKNTYGQLGIGKDYNELVFSSEPIKVELPSVIQVSCSAFSNVCLTIEGLFSFGDNRYGALGLGKKESCNSPQLIDSLQDVEFIESGGGHHICKCLNGDIYSWGFNGYGQLGIGTDTCQNSPVKCINWPDDIVDIKCGGSHTLVLTNTQEVYSCGSNYYGELGIEEFEEEFSSKLQKVNKLIDIIRIECGDNHSMCIDANGYMWVFGDNNSGELGIGGFWETLYSPKCIESLSNVTDISSKGCHVFVKTSNNEIFTFGNNFSLQLGIETEHQCQFVPIQVFQGREDIWWSNINRKSKSKSARFISERPKEENSNPNKIKDYNN